MSADETELFICKKNNPNPSARNVLFTVDNPGAYNALKPIIYALVEDDRCGNICVVSSGIASKNFGVDFRNRFTRAIKGRSSIIKDIETLLCKPDIVICSVSEMNGPEGIMLYGGKSVFGAEKLYLVCDGWGTPGSAFRGNRKNMDMVDGFFCNDAFAKRIICHHAPEVNSKRVHFTGTPVIDTIEAEKADEYRQIVRQRFCLDEDVQVLLFLGDISDGYEKTFGSDPRINEITFEKTVMAMRLLAETHPTKKFAMLLRPHPRDTNKQEMYAVIERLSLPQNLIFIDANVSAIRMNEAAYGADVIASIASTENLLAPLRGRRAIYLGYKGDGLGGALLETVYGGEIMSFLSLARGIEVASSPEEFGKKFYGACLAEKIASSDMQGNSVERILNIVF